MARRAGGEHRHTEISHILFPAGQGAQRTAGGHDAVCIQKIQRIVCAVYRQRILFEEGGQPLDVVRVLVGDQNARTIADVQAQLLERREVVRTPFPISMMMYFSPVRTTLQLPEEPEYNEMNSDISNLKKRTSPSLLHKSSLSGKLLQNRLRGSE